MLKWGWLSLMSLVFFLTNAMAQPAVPRIEPGACPVVVDSSFGTRCGYLVVPENRKKHNGKTIRLPFVMVLSNNPDKKKDPILFTGGGPGNSSLGWATGMSQHNNVLLNDRDCIAFEQRGTRFAQPYIRSYELDTAIKESYRKNLNKDSMIIVGVKRYRKKLEARGIDLAGYNSDETVGDIDDLLKLLHIDSVNLMGGSYSGGLMMAVLQKDPARVRSLVLDSPLPMFIPIDEDEPAHFNEALTLLFRHCDQDSADHVLYGGLRDRFQAYFTSLTGKVFYIPYLEKGARDTILVQYTRNDLLQVIEDQLLDYTKLKDLPYVITEMIKGHHQVYIKKRLDDIFNKNMAPDGMRISVYCADQAAYHSEQVIRQLYQVYPYMEGYHINDVYKAMCDCWQAPPIDRVTKQAFYSDKPVLLADGAMDPACCPLYIDMIHHYMPNSQRFLFLDRTHGVGGPEMNELKRAFLDNPYKQIESQWKNVIAIDGVPAVQHTAPFPPGTKRILFLGNSITYAGKYVTDIEAYFIAHYPQQHFEFINVGLPSETVSGLSEPGHAGGRFPRPDLHERLDRVLAEVRPDVVFACYGMNDGIYMPLDESRFAAFRAGIHWLHQALAACGAKRIIHLTPPVHDDKRLGTKGYNLVLDVYSRWLLAQRDSLQWEVADIHFPMTRFLEERRATDSSFILAKDGIHPGDLGHWLMAKAVLTYLGEPVANAPDVQTTLATNPHGMEIYSLVSKRQAMMKDAWLKLTGFKRPDMPVGMDMGAAKQQYQEMEVQMDALRHQ